MNNQKNSEEKNLFLAMFLSIVLIVIWNVFFIKKPEQNTKKVAQEDMLAEDKQSFEDYDVNFLQKEERVEISNNNISGSISLNGAIFNDLLLLKYRTNIEKNSDNVVLLAPNHFRNGYSVVFGWVCNDKNIQMPNSESIWSVDKTKIQENDVATMKWVNENDVEFIIQISVDDLYMFDVKQFVKNNSDTRVEIASYGMIKKNYNTNIQSYAVLHEGPLLFVENKIKEYKYSKIAKQNALKFSHYPAVNKNSWMGVSDKYWFVSLIPQNDKKLFYNLRPLGGQSEDVSAFQIDLQTTVEEIAPGESAAFNCKLFAGAKELNTLDNYRKKYNIPYFDRAVDFGKLYIITKPIFILLQLIYSMLNNFGVAIFILTVVVKIAMLPFVIKSYVSMAKMAKIQPKINEIQTKHANNKILLNQELIKLFSDNKVSPLSGFLPLFVQIPVFFALYKVLFVTIEMRHAPFWWWINDLSAPDPVNIFAMLNQVLPVNLRVGLWPLFLGITMLIQQNVMPQSYNKDKNTSNTVTKILPYLFVFMFSSFPVGLVVYWSWSNILTILQQLVIRKFVLGDKKKK